jgi:hypothetical protein
MNTAHRNRGRIHVPAMVALLFFLLTGWGFALALFYILAWVAGAFN